MLKIIVTILCFTKTESKLQVELANSSVLLAPVINIISKESPGLSTLNLFYSQMEQESKEITQEVINNIMLKEHTKMVAMQVESIESFKSMDVRKSLNILFVDSYNSFLSINETFNPEIFDYQGKYLIILMNASNNLFDIEKIFQELWEIHIINVNVLITSETKNAVELYTYFPYTTEYCSEVHPVIWKIFRNGQFEGEESFYPKKVKNLHQCPLKVAIFNCNFMKVTETGIGVYETQGIDGEILKALSKSMNFEVNHTFLGPETSRWGFLYPNGSSSGAIKCV